MFSGCAAIEPADVARPAARMRHTTTFSFVKLAGWESGAFHRNASRKCVRRAKRAFDFPATCRQAGRRHAACSTTFDKESPNERPHHGPYGARYAVRSDSAGTRKLGRARERVTAHLRAQCGLDASAAMERVEAMVEAEAANGRPSVPNELLTWWNLDTLAQADPARATERWNEVREAARAELATGPPSRSKRTPPAAGSEPDSSRSAPN